MFQIWFYRMHKERFFWTSFSTTPQSIIQKGWNLKEDPLSIKIVDCWVLGFVLKTDCKKKPWLFSTFGNFKSSCKKTKLSLPHTGQECCLKSGWITIFSKKLQLPFWCSQNQKTNSILRKGFEIENSLAVMSPLNGHNKGPYKRSFWFQHLWTAWSGLCCPFDHL